MSTIILSNGSKWFGEEPDTIEVLKQRLKEHLLHPSFDGVFIQSPDEIKRIANKAPPELEGKYNFHGNFLEISHVFNIYTDDQDLIKELGALIRANVECEDYQDALKTEQRKNIAYKVHLKGE